MDVRLAGERPPVEAVEAALADLHEREVDPVRVAPEHVGGADLAVVAGPVDGDALATADEATRDTDTTWIGVELGGVGGRAVAGVQGAVSGFPPEGGCFQCLRTRVDAADPELGADTAEAETKTRIGAGTPRFLGSLAGREAAALLAGDPSRAVTATPDGATVGGVLEVPHAARTLLPVPECACDGAIDRDLDYGWVDRDVESALARAEFALDERVGPIESVGEVESFPAPYYLAKLANTDGFSDAAAPRHAAGVADDWNPAFMKALGEALERYSAATYRTDRFRHAPPGSLSNCVRPDRFVRSADAPAVDGEAIPWVRGWDLRDDESVALPAEAVYFPPPEERYLRSVTTGLGLGSSTVEALLSGLYEVVERDAAMIAWYSTFEPLAVTVDDEDFAALARRARSEDLAVSPALLTVDVDVPVVGVAVHREGEWPRFAAAAAADLDPTAAASSALEEAIQNWMELRSMGPEDAAGESTAIGRYAETPAAARRFFAGEDPIPVSSVAPDDPRGDDESGSDDGRPAGRVELDRLVEGVSDAGLTPYAARITPRDVDLAGFEAVRVLVPAAQPLFVDVDDPLFGDRVRTVPASLGYEADTDRPPHPFP